MKWLDPIWWKGQARLLVLECPEDAEGAYTFLILNKDQNKIQVEDSGICNGLKDCQSLLESRKKIPVLLCLWNAFVMEGLIEPDQINDPVNAITGLDMGDEGGFGIQRFPASEDRWWVALIRQTQIDEFLDRVPQIKERVAGVCISRRVWLYYLPSLIPSSLSQNISLQLSETELFFKCGLLSRREEVAAEEVSAPSIPELAILAEIEAPFLDLHAAAAGLWLSGPLESDAPNSERSLLFAKTSLLKNILLSGAILLGIWAFSLLSLRIRGEQQKAELEFTYTQNLPVLEAIAQLDEKIAQRESLQVRLSTRTLAPTKASFYLDRLASLTPPEVQLKQLNYAPEEDDLKRAGLTSLSDWDLIVQGECNTSGPVANYNALLETQTWADEVKVLASGFDFQSGVYQFTFLIQVEDV